jgi:hypothetical protein
MGVADTVAEKGEPTMSQQHTNRSRSHRSYRYSSRNGQGAYRSYCPCCGTGYTYNDHCHGCGCEEHEESCHRGTSEWRNRHSRRTGQNYRRRAWGRRNWNSR